jgi:hypothetical protein
MISLFSTHPLSGLLPVTMAGFQHFQARRQPYVLPASNLRTSHVYLVSVCVISVIV